MYYAPLNTTDLTLLGKRYLEKNFFRGVLPSDHLPSKRVRKRPAGYIINTDPHTKPGEHWIAVVLQEGGKNIVFDSYASKQWGENIQNFLDRQGPEYHYWNVPRQTALTTCGYHAINFLLGYSPNDRERVVVARIKRLLRKEGINKKQLKT